MMIKTMSCLYSKTETKKKRIKVIAKERIRVTRT